MRPNLNRNIELEPFKQYYWLKKELQEFCRSIGASASGSKEELTNRIEWYLTTGEIQKPQKRMVSKKTTTEQLSLETVIGDNHRCSQTVRAFFKVHIPNFHFSTFIQKFFKNHPQKTYQDVIVAWHEEEARKKEPNYKTEIGSQFEYNQFIRDFFDDPYNQSLKREDAIKAWKEVKVRPGSNKYISRKEI
ncbi:DUF6434 domain-containing protein [Alkalihalobacillus trypoxylicola]|uniref:Cytoplasmic protein n=1 Tax=Alkalihalobacillus trypoxylicola TaxID=519424 RepID=A0A162CQW9_9BACI|nr:DUF6434 domain-containing protein [Alkalihalobacillus trypoxylicola]KYG26064.1 cytoplasmic protein [Alkalihalobacillus trypoxylicola]